MMEDEGYGGMKGWGDTEAMENSEGGTRGDFVPDEILQRLQPSENIRVHPASLFSTELLISTRKLVALTTSV